MEGFEDAFSRTSHEVVMILPAKCHFCANFSYNNHSRFNMAPNMSIKFDFRKKKEDRRGREKERHINIMVTKNYE